MGSTNYLEMTEQSNSPVLKGAPTGIDGQIYTSIRDYRGWRKSLGGLLITSGPTDKIMSISVPITKNHSAAGRALKIFLERNRGAQLIFNDRYDPSARELFDMLSATDGAANFENGRLTAVKRYIEEITGTGEMEGGTRHRAAAYASRRGLMSHVLSEETRNITVFREGKPIVIDPYLNREESLSLTKGIKCGGLGTYTGKSGRMTLRECGRVYEFSYRVFKGNDGKEHRIPDDKVVEMLGGKMLASTA